MLRLNRPLLRFGVVGAIGFAVDGGVMQLITATTGVSPLIARAFSFPLALSVTWALNRTWTFETGRTRAPLSQYRRYVAVQIAGFAINYAIFAGLVMMGGVWRDWPLLALMVGALVSMIFTYVLSRQLVFSGPTAAAIVPLTVTATQACGGSQQGATIAAPLPTRG
jgi:putative flippase GtrA